jgi:hypothetical protein
MGLTMQSATDRSRRRYRRFAPLFMTFGAVLIASAALAAVTTFAPPGEHLSVQAPPNPTQKDTDANGTKIREWSVTDDGFFYLVQHGVHPGAVFQPAQLDADLKDFTTATNASVTAQQTTTVPGPDGNLPALRFSFKMPSGTSGEGVWTIMGDEAFGALILDTTKAGRQGPMDAFLDSLRIVK